MQKLLVGILLVAMTTTVASGYSITQPLNFTGQPDYERDLTFNQFDDQGGTLQLDSVEVVVSVTVQDGALRVDNDAQAPASGTIEFGADVLVSSTVSLIDNTFQPIFGMNDLKATGGTTLALGPDDGDGEVGGIPNFSWLGIDFGEYIGQTEQVTHGGFVDPSVHGQYIGLGTYTITIDANQVASYTAFSGVQALIDPLTTSGTVEVTYNYTPEPTTLGLLGIGSLLLSSHRRRTR